ncbi:unnamed protein product, partial [Candidula unifasciata]
INIISSNIISSSIIIVNSSIMTNITNIIKGSFMLSILYSQNTLTCGVHYNCCSPYWKMCIKDSDCCDHEHVCRAAEDFLYDRCLYPSSGGLTHEHCNILSTTSIICTVLLIWLGRFAGEG